MKRILLIGNAPLPNDNTKTRPAAGLRTYQFLKSLNSADLSVKMVNIAMPECYDEPPVRTASLIPKDDPDLLKAIQAAHDEFKPDAIVGVNTYPSYVASQIHSQAPFWADLNGWIMAEAQAQAYKMDSNAYIPHYGKMERNIVKWADKLSTVSEAQRYAVLGELASLGRLNKESFGYEFVHAIANGQLTIDNDQLSMGNDQFSIDVPEDAFVLAWIGGYNTWVDEDTLFKGVEDAMAVCDKLYFVSTGGEISGLDNKTFAKFKKMVDGSNFRDRFVFLGWVATANIPYIYERADCGLNVDRRCVETMTGARNRINEMMAYGLPVITTLGSEISYEVMRVGAGLGVASGRAVALSDAIVSIYSEWRGGGENRSVQFEKYGVKGREYIENECNYEYLMRNFLKWARDPSPAPDRFVKVRMDGVGRAKGALKYAKEAGVGKIGKKLWGRMRK